MSDMVILMNPAHKKCWGLVPDIMTRIARFAAEQDSETDGPMVARSWVQHFVCASEEMFVLAFVDLDEEEVFGHILAQRQESFGAVSVFVMQYQLDRPIGRKLRSLGMDLLEAIARRLGARKIVALCENPAVARAHRVYHGFEDWGTVVRRRVSEEA